MKRTTLALLALAMLFVMASCGGKKKKSYDEVAMSGLTTRTGNLCANLKAYADKGTIVGQVYGTLQGVGWQCDSDRSDIHSVCGDRPAAVAYELAGVESGKKANADNMPFDAIRRDVLANFRRGALVTMHWTVPDFKGNDDVLKQYVSRVADYLGSLQDDYGIKAPVVLFICPLTGKAWYDRLSADDYTKLYCKVQTMIDDADVSNAIYGYSETYPSSTFLSRYPDSNVDVINAVCLSANGNDSGVDYGKTLEAMVTKALPFAQEHNNALGITVGEEGVPHATVFSQAILPVLRNHRISYMMFGANRGDTTDGHYFIPFPGNGNEAIQDFMQLYNDASTVFMRSLNGLYLKH